MVRLLIEWPPCDIGQVPLPDSLGATKALHFPVAVMPERHANRLATATTEPGQDTAIREVLFVNVSRAAPL
jgi:hypothetical protein